MPKPHRSLALLAALLLSGPAVFAFAPKSAGDLTPLVRSLPWVVPPQGAAELLPDTTVSQRGEAGLVREAGGPWFAQADPLSGNVRRALGTGIPLIAGEANGLPARASAPNAAELEALGRAFVDRHLDLFGVDLAEWVFVPSASQSIDDGRLQAILFQRVIGGVPLAYSQIQLVLNRGNLTYINVTGTDAVTISTAPSLDATETWAGLLREAGKFKISIAGAEVEGKAPLLVLPVQVTSGGPVSHRLVREHTFTLPGEMEVWRARVDAHSGEVVEFEDMNKYACSLDAAKVQGQVRGGVKPARADEAEVMMNFPYVQLNDDAAKKVTDSNGYYFYSGKAADSNLPGQYFKMVCMGCTPNPPLAATAGDGIIDFGMGGVDATSNGKSTPADRSAFFHLNVARAIGFKWIPNNTWLAGNMTVNVNINNSCNASFGGNSMNFFRSSGTCWNTGEIRDVMQHEWGHGMDANDGIRPNDGAMGEAYGDYIAIFVDHDSCVGQSFFKSVARSSGQTCATIPDCTAEFPCTGVRNIDELRQSGTRCTGCPASSLLTVAMLQPASGTPCGADTAGCTGPLQKECHCEGELPGQAAFHLAWNLLTGKRYETCGLTGGCPTGTPLAGANPAFKAAAAWYLHERMFFKAMSLAASYGPSTIQTRGTGWYDAFVAGDDDDGNLANGTPQAEYINQAFIHHGMHEASRIASDGPNCVPPGDPPITLQALFDPTTGNPQVKISWPRQAGSKFYVPYRNQRLSDVWLPVRTQVLDDPLMPTYDVYDEPVQIGATYNYVVVAVSDTGCPSPGADIKTFPVALPDISAAVGLITDAVPDGDGDGIPEPGERVQVRVDLTEVAKLVGLTNASVKLTTSDPLALVTVPGPINYGTVPANGTVPGSSSFEVAISVSHGCGTTVPLKAAISGDNGCMVRGLWLTIPAVSCAPALKGEAVPLSIAVTKDNNNPACTDNDNVPDDGETVDVEVTVRNPGTAGVTNATVQLVSGSPKFVIAAPNTVNLGAIAQQTNAVATFKATVQGAVCLDTADLTATTNSTENVFPVPTTKTIALEEDRVSTTLAADFETDFGGWTAVGFERNAFRANSGTYSAFAGPKPQPKACGGSTDTNGSNACSTLTSPTFTPNAGSRFFLSNYYVFEPRDTQYWDRANVHVIENGTHTLITPFTGAKQYVGASGASTTLCHIDSEDGWAGNAAAGATWGQSVFNLDAFAGKSIQLEINYNTDDLANCEGFYVDDMLVSNAFQRACDALSCNTNKPNVVVKACPVSDKCGSTGLGDGVNDPGDDVTYLVTLENNGPSAASDVQGNFVVNGGGVIVSGGTIGGAPRIDIPPGQSVVHTAIVKVNGNCGDTLDVSVQNLKDASNAFAANLTACDVAVGANQPAGTVVLNDAVGGRLIPEALPPVARAVTSAVPVAVTTATLRINVTHGRIADLRAALIGPKGTRATADAAVNASLDVTALVNADGLGAYTLLITDSVFGTIGTLDAWSLTLDVPAYSKCTPCVAGCTAPGLSVVGTPSICLGGDATFKATFANPGTGLFDYEWNFGDGTPVVVVSDPLAPASHRFTGPGPSYTVTLSAKSKSSASCDQSASTVLNITSDTPATGRVGNILKGTRVGADAHWVWPGSGVNPLRFVVFKAFDKRECVDTPAGIGNEARMAEPVMEMADDANIVFPSPALALYEVYPSSTCGNPALP